MIAKIQRPRGARYFSSSLLCLSCFLTSILGKLSAATILVGPPPASIQAAIDSANPGDTIQLSDGTYVEEILITIPLTLNGNGMGVSIIQCPTTPNPLTNSFVFIPNGGTYHPFVMAQGAVSGINDINIQNLTIDGNSQPSNFLSYRFDGIGYHNAGGTIQNVEAINVQDDSPGGPTQHGFAIAGAVDDGTPYTINVLNCNVNHFQKAGIDMRGATLNAVLTGNTVTGETPPSTANANGIVVQYGAQVTISSNTVTNLISTVAGNDCVGILLSGAAANSSITNNTSNGSNIGIYSDSSGDNLVVSGNTVNNNTDIGINVIDTAGLTTLQNNILTDNANFNMYLQDSSTTNTFQLGGNQFIGSAIGLGIEGNTTTGPAVLMNADSFITPTTYYIQEVNSPIDIWPSSDNVFFDGLVSGHITLAEYNAIQAKIVGNLSDPSLGVVLQYITPVPPTLTTIDPTSGSPAGGNTVTIMGDNFLSSNTQVFFGVVPGTDVVVVSDNATTVTAPPGIGTVDITVVTPFGTTPTVSTDAYTYVAAGAPLPPTNFLGEVKKNGFLNKLEYRLKSIWDPSSSPDVVSYRIYKNGNLVEEVEATDPFVFKTCFREKNAAKEYAISAVNSENLESSLLAIRIVYD